MLRDIGTAFLIVWVPSKGDFELGKKAKEAAREATEQVGHRKSNHADRNSRPLASKHTHHVRCF